MPWSKSWVSLIFANLPRNYLEAQVITHMAKILKIIFLLLVVNAAQAVNLPDSMQKVLDKAGSDSLRIRVLLTASGSAAHPDPELGTVYAKMALRLSQKNGNRRSMAQSYYNIGTIDYESNTLKESHSNFLKASAIFIPKGDSE